MAVKPIPDGYHAVTPYLCISGAAKALDFYRDAFGAVERFRLEMPGGDIGHAELQIGDSVLMLAEACEESSASAPDALGGTTVSIHLYVEDVDALFARALAAGASEIRPPGDQFYGDRTGMLRDPFGHVWALATHTEDLSEAEIGERLQAMMPAQPA